MKELRTEIDIQAPAERVWQTLIDFEQYPTWNPLMPRIEGQAVEGQALTVRITPPGGMAMTLKPKVLRVQPAREFRWLGVLAVSGLFNGEHIFELHPNATDGTRFVQREEFTGVLVPLLMPLVRKSTQRGFEAMNLALKQRAEAASS